MKQFSLEEYLKNPSQKVITRDGREVRIICTDAKLYDNNSFPIIALIQDKQGEKICSYMSNGQVYKEYKEFKNDLFFAPIKKEGWVNIYKRMSKCLYVEESIYYSKEIAIKNKCGDNYVTTIKIEWEE